MRVVEAVRARQEVRVQLLPDAAKAQRVREDVRVHGLVHEELRTAVAQIEVAVAVAVAAESARRRLVRGVHAPEGAVPGLGHHADVGLVHLLPLVLAKVVHPHVAEVLVEPAAAARHVQAVPVVRVQHAVARRRTTQAERQLAPLLC